MYSADSHANVGHAFIALRIASTMPMRTYFDRIEELAALVTNAQRIEGVDKILLPGERRWQSLDDQTRLGIEIDEETRLALDALARNLGVPGCW